MQRSLTISLALIVKPDAAEAKKLDTCLSSCAEYFDEIVITQAGKTPSKEVSAVINKYNGKESFFEWCDDFAAARNYNFAQATGDWIVWLDADDVLQGGDNLRKDIELAEANNVSGLAFMYHYKVVNGKVVDKHWKTQAIKNNNHAEWKGVIHEDLLPKRNENWASVKDVVRVHTATEEDSEASLLRNIKILEKAIEKEPKEPRHYFYSARCYLGVMEWEKVIEVIGKYLELSDWKAERADAWNMAGEAYMNLGQLDAALRAHNDAILELEDAPDAYIFKARIYVKKGEWKNALTCLEIAEQRDKEAPTLKRDALYDHDLYILAALANLNLGKFDAGLSCAERAFNNHRTKKAKEMVSLAKELKENNDLTVQYQRLGKTLMKEPKKLMAVLDTAPQHIQDDPRLLALRFGAEQPKEWADNSVAIFCGNSAEDWDGNSIKNGGIGGSETAVIEIAKRLVKAGKEVVVYNRCGAFYGGKVIDGVTYRNYWEFNKRDKFNVLWLWRSPILIQEGVEAKKILVDMHDVSSTNVFHEGVNDKITKVMVKTEYHKSLYPTVPEDKFVVVGNGIDIERFKATGIKKNKNKFIYTSTPNRGLEQLCQMWPEIKKQIPEAELHTFYGWNTFYEMHKENPAQMEWMRKMQDLMSQDGIIVHDRVDQITLSKHQLEAGFWLYPTAFPEIHCITALEMQAAGVYPITTGYAALAETQQSGEKLPGDINDKEWQKEFIDAVVRSYNSFEGLDTDTGYAYAKENDWDNVTKVWLQQM